MEGFYIVHALQPAQPNISIYFKDDIFLNGNCAERVNYCMSLVNVLFMLFWYCVCGARLTLFPQKWLNYGEYICFCTLGICTFCYVFIILLFHTSGLHHFFQL